MKTRGHEGENTGRKVARRGIFVHCIAEEETDCEEKINDNVKFE